MKTKPRKEKVCKGRDLAEACKVKLTDAEAAAWVRDLQMGRKALQAPVDKWR